MIPLLAISLDSYAPWGTGNWVEFEIFLYGILVIVASGVTLALFLNLALVRPIDLGTSRLSASIIGFLIGLGLGLWGQSVIRDHYFIAAIDRAKVTIPEMNPLTTRSENKEGFQRNLGPSYPLSGIPVAEYWQPTSISTRDGKLYQTWKLTVSHGFFMPYGELIFCPPSECDLPDDDWTLVTTGWFYRPDAESSGLWGSNF